MDLYDGHYGRLGADPLVAVSRETYDEDLGQASWITGAEARAFFRALELGPRCGGTTHWRALQPNAEGRRGIAVNLRMTEPGP